MFIKMFVYFYEIEKLDRVESQKKDEQNGRIQYADGESALRIAGLRVSEELRIRCSD